MLRACSEPNRLAASNNHKLQGPGVGEGAATRLACTATWLVGSSTKTSAPRPAPSLPTVLLANSPDTRSMPP